MDLMLPGGRVGVTGECDLKVSGLRSSRRGLVANLGSIARMWGLIVNAAQKLIERKRMAKLPFQAGVTGLVDDGQCR
jgi:hypothetical protein